MFDAIHQFEPLLPFAQQAALHAQAGRIAQASYRLAASAHPTTCAALQALVRAMNSYYSNRIEGQATHPLHIEQALHNDFSPIPDIARLQRIALAHIEAEKSLEAQLAGLPEESVLSSDFLIACHAALYGRLAEADRTTDDGQLVAPGAVRTGLVEVGRHIPPTAAAIPRFLARMDQVYARPANWDAKLVAIGCLHQRAAWVHPFIDGNGRAVRLQSHCALWPLSNGLWSPSRGLARAQKDYYARLTHADAPRRGDLDGRGNLTDAGLAEWCRFFLDLCEDQVTYMARMLDLTGMRRRIEALIAFRAAHDKAIRPEAVLPLYHVFAAGPVTRGEFAQMTGLGERTARALLARLLATRLLVSESPLGPVRFGLPLDALGFLLPALYPEAETAPALP